MRQHALSLMFLGVTVASCDGGRPSVLNGAGATFPYPIYSKWFLDYADATGVRINYQSIGSGGGIKQFSDGVVDFGATDGPMSDEEMARTKYGEVLHFPTVLGADVVVYNLPSIDTPLRLTGQALAEIFLGRIRRWNDPRLAALNPALSMPDEDILVVHRSDGSGTTYIFTDYLNTASSAWTIAAGGPGRGKEVAWPVGIGGKGNEGVSGQVKQTPGSIGYVELAYAKQNNLQVAHIRNAAGEYVEAAAASITAAAEGAIDAMGADTDYRISIVNAPGASSYPIASFTWILVYRTPPDAARGRVVQDFLRWMYSTGQQSAAALDYAPLPPALAQRLTDRLAQIQLTGSQ
ncbi:MAG TPA: phosphate ABC transporter substrate-binding protein PstS [Gemmatimonadaceae bacterium]